MCTTKSFRDAAECRDCEVKKYENPEMFCKDGCLKIPPAKSAYELIMEKKALSDRKKIQVTMWFIDEKCKECGFDIYTDGKLFWCSECCIQNGKRGAKAKEGFGFINDLIR